jgi:hypothetical protein
LNSGISGNRNVSRKRKEQKQQQQRLTIKILPEPDFVLQKSRRFGEVIPGQKDQPRQ